ncbi:Probable lactoylglutathione lyase, chloroplastic, partial [Linum perenne]
MVGAAGNMAQASKTTQENILDWVKRDNRRMLHVVYRVGDLDKTIKYTFDNSKFYTECLGMKLLRKRDIPEERVPRLVGRSELVTGENAAKDEDDDDDVFEIPPPPANKNKQKLETHRVLPADPVKKYEDMNLLTRRRRMKWSSEEETALMNDIKQFGPGLWKEILNSRRDQFNNRTTIQMSNTLPSSTVNVSLSIPDDSDIA